MRRGIPLILALLVAPLLRAEPVPPARDLRRFDFEERALGNAEDLPMHWAKVEGKGFPHYVNGKLATGRARSGQYGFRMDLNGGSALYRYDPGRIRVQAGAHYHVEAYVQTTPLPNARARLTAYFADIAGRAIRGTVRHSDLYSQAPGDDSWKKLAVDLSADDREAHSLVVEIGLLQPAQYAPELLGDQTLFPQDIRGSAWFDDVAVSQVPRVSLSTAKPGNVFRRSEALTLSVVVNDRSTDDLTAQLVVNDATGQTIYQRTGSPDLSTGQVVRPGERRLPISLPALPTGWYRASIVMVSAGQFLGKQSLDFIVLADDGPDPLPDERFGVIATGLPYEAWKDLPQVLPLLGAGRVKLAVWDNAGDVQQYDAAAFDELLLALRDRRIVPTACLIDLPPSVARKIRGDSWLNLLQARPEDWQPQLAYLVSRHANYLEHWQLGADGSTLFVDKPQMRQVYALLYREFAKLMQQPDLAMPWPAWHELEGQTPATVALSVPPTILPNQLPLYMQDLAARNGNNLALSLTPLDAERYGREEQIRDYAQRLVCALAGNAQRMDVPLPMEAKRDGVDLVRQPSELFIILRTIAMTLGQARCLGKVTIAEGVEGYLFDRQGTSVLAIWDKGTRAGMKQLALTLGERPRAIDLWGNVTHLLRPSDPRQVGQVQLTVGPTPIFLVDIDGYLAQLRASVAVDQPLIESSFRGHRRHVRFRNPYPQAIAGTLKLKAPSGWNLNPSSMVFSLNPGETFEREVNIEFPYNSFAGAKTVEAQFEFQSDKVSVLNVPITLTLGLSDVGTQTLALRDGKDIVVQQVITNYGDKPINYTAFASVPGQARQERLVTNLAAGRTTIKLYRFPGAKTPASGKIRTGVKELEGTRILNDEVEIQ